MRWCTVTVTESDGRRHSVDVQATSTFDAAHLFVVEAKKERAVGLPKPTFATVFEVVAAGKIYHVTGTALQRWIVEKRSCGKVRRATFLAKGPDWNNGSALRAREELGYELARPDGNTRTGKASCIRTRRRADSMRCPW